MELNSVATFDYSHQISSVKGKLTSIYMPVFLYNLFLVHISEELVQKWIEEERAYILSDEKFKRTCKECYMLTMTSNHYYNHEYNMICSISYS